MELFLIKKLWFIFNIYLIIESSCSPITTSKKNLDWEPNADNLEPSLRTSMLDDKDFDQIVNDLTNYNADEGKQNLIIDQNKRYQGLKKQKCPDCNYESSDKSNLKRHVKTVHQGLKPYKCPDCDYRATQKGNVQQHVRDKHQGLKPYKCPDCDYRATRKSTIQKHVWAKHQGLKPHKCTDCDYEATQKNSVKRHMLAKH